MTKNRLLLINPPFPRKVSGVPLQLLYLAAAFEGTGVDVRVLDLDVKKEPASDLEKTLKDFRPTHTGVTSYSPNYPESLDILRQVKSFKPGIVTISGGPHEIATASFAPQQGCIDYRVESTFGENDLLNILGVNKKIDSRGGLFPALNLLEDNPQYHFDSGLFEGRRMTQLLSATGCSEHCSFCSAQQGYKPFSNEDVLQQLEKIAQLGYKAVFFNDPNFTNPSRSKEMVTIGGNPDIYFRVKSLMKAIIDSGVARDIQWGCHTKANYVNPQVLDLMAEAGCKYVAFALETVDKDSLITTHKGVTPDDVKRAIGLSKKRNIVTGLYVMLGVKSNSEIDFKISSDTLDCVEELKPEYLSISILANYPMKDRITGKPSNVDLDYANNKYSREPVWLNFDEGWGAFHPNVSAKQAQLYVEELDRRKSKKPHLWDPKVSGAIKRF